MHSGRIDFRDAPGGRGTIKTGQTHAQRYGDRLLQMILDGEIDTTFLISHHLTLEEAANGYRMCKEQQNEVTKVVLKPDGLRQ